MTEGTNNHLIQLLKSLQTKRAKLSGLGTDYTSGLHDDPALVRDIQQTDNDINKISHILKNTEVLPIRTDTSEIYVGNRVVVKFEDEDTEELFKVGTTTDASYPMNKFRWVSIESPLGRELLGKKKGDSVIYKINFVDKNVDILDVLSEE